MTRLCRNCERTQKDQYCEPCGVWTRTEQEEQDEAEAFDRAEAERINDMLRIQNLFVFCGF